MESEDPNETAPMESVEDDVVEAPMDELQANEMNARLSWAFEYLTACLIHKFSLSETSHTSTFSWLHAKSMRRNSVTECSILSKQ